MEHSPDRLLEEKTVFAEGLADPILVTRCCPCLESPGTPSSLCSPQRPGLPNLAQSRAARLADGRPGGAARAHRRARGGACDLPRGRPRLGAGGWWIKSPQGAPRGPLALLSRGARPSPDLRIQPVSSCLLRSPVCLLLSVLSSESRGWAGL